MTRLGVDLTTQLSPFIPATEPTDGQMDALRAWLPNQRWFPVKAGLTLIEPWISVRFDDGSAPVTHIVRAHGASGVSLVHVPVIVKAPEEGLTRPRGFIAEVDGQWLLDAMVDPEYWTSWLTLAQWGEGDDGARGPLDVSGAIFISGEQSNSSVIFPNLGGGAILKVFRPLSRGANPDVDVPRALVQAGWDGVPRPLAWLELSWAAHETGLLDLGVLSEFVAGASDGFELACAYASSGRSFAEPARALGATVAQMHSALARALPTSVTVSMDWMRGELRRRARQVIAAEPVLGARAGAIETLLSNLGHEPGHESGSESESPIALQHIHGDLHLGQVLSAPDGGWRVLDFEGEPMRPVAERVRPDLPARDVAGVLRSFDYAAAVGESSDPTWAAEARAAFLAGYNDDAQGIDDALLRALELDKALYEVGYESANRPDWVAIPLAGIDRLLAHT